jgi:hypothetical protein
MIFKNLEKMFEKHESQMSSLFDNIDPPLTIQNQQLLFNIFENIISVLPRFSGDIRNIIKSMQERSINGGYETHTSFHYDFWVKFDMIIKEARILDPDEFVNILKLERALVIAEFLVVNLCLNVIP